MAFEKLRPERVEELIGALNVASQVQLRMLNATVPHTIPITLLVEFFLIFFEFSFLLMHWQTF